MTNKGNKNHTQKKIQTLVRTRGETPISEKKTERNSTMGVFPFPPHVRFPTLITGTGNLHFYSKSKQRIGAEIFKIKNQTYLFFSNTPQRYKKILARMEILNTEDANESTGRKRARWSNGISAAK